MANVLPTFYFQYVEQLSFVLSMFSDRCSSRQMIQISVFSYFCNKHTLWVLTEALLTSIQVLCFFLFFFMEK